MAELAVFISHSSKDVPWVDWLAQQVGIAGVRPYLAQHDPQPGVSLAEKVQRQIEASVALIVLLTSNSVSAPYVQQEIGYALRASKLVTPLVQPGIDASAMAMLAGVEYIPFDFRQPEHGLSQLLLSLRNLVERHAQQERDQLLLVVCIAGVLLVAAAASSSQR